MRRVIALPETCPANPTIVESDRQAYNRVVSQIATSTQFSGGHLILLKELNELYNTQYDKVLKDLENTFNSFADDSEVIVDYLKQTPSTVKTLYEQLGRLLELS
jgi:inosine/xanthosine triphosphate pyrophosphatase family protein